tara:strand:- start:1648 stop:1764 length:117 start_codon:yes stop_codon:yes gene_type:complete
MINNLDDIIILKVVLQIYLDDKIILKVVLQIYFYVQKD